MTALHEIALTLRFFGDELDPEELTSLLGAQPTVGVAKGGTWFTKSGAAKVARRGSWRLSAPRSHDGDLDHQIKELLEPLTNDLTVWRELTRRYWADIFCGLFLAHGNEGLSLAPATLAAVGERGLELNFDIYGAELNENRTRSS